MNRRVRTGFSPCPNDTFMFHGLVSGHTLVENLIFDAVLEDIEELNRRAIADADPLDVTKLSVSALAHIAGKYRVLSSGAAIGRGCGPLVVQKANSKPLSLSSLSGQRIAIPGEYTTAHLLLRIFASANPDTRFMRFDQIMPAIAEGTVDAGVIIHEGRFTYEDHDLVAIADLGELWEGETGLPLPLGVICAHSSLGEDLTRKIETGIENSILAGREEPAHARSFIREHAQELNDDVCAAHIDLYVNDYSVNLGSEGRRAITALLQKGAEAGALPETPPLW